MSERLIRVQDRLVDLEEVQLIEPFKSSEFRWSGNNEDSTTPFKAIASFQFYLKGNPNPIVVEESFGSWDTDSIALEFFKRDYNNFVNSFIRYKGNSDEVE